MSRDPSGFMVPSAHGASVDPLLRAEWIPDGNGGGITRWKDAPPDTLIPCTAKQIKDMGTGIIDASNFLTATGVEVTTVRLLGKMVNKQVSDNSVFFTLADETGCVKARVWFENGIDVMCSASISDGVYVKLTGRLRAELGVPVVAAYSLSVVTNFNDITHHFLDCIYVHLMMRSDHAKRVVHSLALIPFAASAPLASTARRVPERRLSVKAEEENLTDMIMGFLDQPGIGALEHGVSVNLVVEHLGIPESEARSTLDKLADLGCVFQTIDDDHFKSCAE
ncbi:hypothetical protein CFC21_096387 [Triticum aestivum]|uniref:Replication protein A C-terminal domain-containing protein n=2 Tax=Triticum aestivum TaxID=4565 RepID=A0A3B6RE70_WHEAT|nr:replication protein A 32 kDa subunit B-like [Triticum aestivum]KAF7094026.1 hypothetical protein CFC21_096387 [Triticum aestivum]